MIPPIDPTVTNGNPKFHAVYEDLCVNKLNPDGTTKILDQKILKERETFAEDLRKARIEVARREAVVLGLKSLAEDEEALPEDLRELVAVIAAVLEGQVAEEDRDLLQEDIAKFKSNVKPISDALSRHIERNVMTLATVLDPENSPSPQNVASEIRQLQTSLSDSEQRLNTLKPQLAPAIAELHSLHRQTQHQCIALLEQTLHGSIARGSKAKAEYLALVTEGMSKKLALQQSDIDSKVYSPEAQKLVRERAAEVDARARVVKGKMREAEEKLERYQKVGGMEGVAGEYAEVLAEQARVRGEIERLENGG